ncbi:MAG: hypothetical protein CSA42_00305 [Gammaproteobacteria bacterium]|nr:MAG: hypothetical protein CSB21_00005 [Deltaproteobacteria bacterium]PIE48129.1 MAG: hypothetical protein CSA42_00305 [Gammaproteobacteria bacterium]
MKKISRFLFGNNYEQQIRIKRFLIAAFSYVVFILLILFSVKIGILPYNKTYMIIIFGAIILTQVQQG